MKQILAFVIVVALGVGLVLWNRNADPESQLSNIDLSGDILPGSNIHLRFFGTQTKWIDVTIPVVAGQKFKDGFRIEARWSNAKVKPDAYKEDFQTLFRASRLVEDRIEILYPEHSKSASGVLLMYGAQKRERLDVERAEIGGVVHFKSKIHSNFRSTEFMGERMTSHFQKKYGGSLSELMALTVDLKLKN